VIHSFAEQISLPFAALVASTVSGVTGLGGGALLMAFMSQSVDPKTLIPLHGLVQIGSNGSRVYWGFRNVHWQIVRKFLLGAIIGGAIGALLPIHVEPKMIGLAIGLFLITTTWLPIERLIVKIAGPYWLLGALSTFTSLFVGVSGPLVHPILIRERNLNRHAFIATEASCAGLTHVAKFVVYSYWGFAISGYAAVLAVMILMTLMGAYIGGRVLHRVSERRFRLLIKVIVTVLGLKMLVDQMSF